LSEDKSKYKVVKAGKRFGKTKWALFEICKGAGLRPGGTFWYIAPTNKHVKQIAWLDLKAMMPMVEVEKYREDELLMVMKNGSRVQLVGAENEDSLRGPKLDGVVFDEASYIDEYVWPAIISGQLIGNESEGNGWASFISSPNKRGKNWFSRFQEEAKGKPGWGSWFFTIYDNPTLSAESIETLKREVPDDVWNLEYMAQESDFSGVIVSEFEYAKHVGDLPPLIRRTEVLRWMDWGLTHPTVCLFAYVDPSVPMVYVYDEYFRTGLVISEHAKNINLMTGNETVERTVIDPSASRRDPTTGRSVLDEFSRCGMYCVGGDNRDRGYDVMKMFFKKNMIKISPKCKNLISQLRTLQWGDKENDDACDSLRYGLLDVHDRYRREFEAKPQVQVVMEEELRKAAEINLYNPNMFGSARKAKMDWVSQEVEVY
jgi:hypothetical protein